MRFCTVINCMDGRVQLPVIQFLQKRFHAEYVDSITEAGPNKILAGGKNSAAVESILSRLQISVEKHHTLGIAVVGHHDCAGNPTHKEAQIEHIEKAVHFLKNKFSSLEIIGLWVGSDWAVKELLLL